MCDLTTLLHLTNPCITCRKSMKYKINASSVAEKVTRHHYKASVYSRPTELASCPLRWQLLTSLHREVHGRSVHHST